MKLVHIAIVPTTQQQEVAIALSREACKALSGSFELTLRIPQHDVRLPHVTILAATVPDDSEAQELIRAFKQGLKDAEITEHHLERMQLDMTQATFVEVYQFLQVDTPHFGISKIHDIACAAARAQEAKIQTISGDGYRPHITLTRSEDASQARLLAQQFTREMRWRVSPLWFRTLQVNVRDWQKEDLGTFPGGTTLVNSTRAS